MTHAIVTAENLRLFKNVFPCHPYEGTAISSLLNGNKATKKLKPPSPEGLRVSVPARSTLICARSFACARAAHYLSISRGEQLDIYLTLMLAQTLLIKFFSSFVLCHGA